MIDPGLDRPAALRAGRLNAELQEGGAAIDVEYVMDGAVALDRDEPVLMRNAADFERLSGLDVETY